MTLGFESIGFSLAAGVLSTLSPCVLPILPILITSALTAHRHGVLALAAGLAISFVTAGLALATFGHGLGLSPAATKTVGAIFLVVFGVMLVSQWMQDRLSLALAPIGNFAQSSVGRLNLDSLPGQFALGLAMGVIWSPCVGPTLGAATVLAMQGEHLSQVAVIMSMFGIGAALPLVVIGRLSRSAMSRNRERMMRLVPVGKVLLGGMLIVFAGLGLSGWDRVLETFLVEHSPDWLIDLTTSF